MTAIQTLQKRIGVTPDGQFGPASAKAFKNFFKLSSAETAHFLGQCEHESGGFKVFVENLNYSADGLLRVFPKYFTPATAASYARNPEKIANRVYANRMDNGGEASGDGWKYRGHGAIQLTGRFNFQQFSDEMKDSTIMTNTDLVADKYAFDSALWFFNKNHIFDWCKVVDNNSIKMVTKKINGGYNGLDERVKLTNKYYGWVK